MSLLVTSLQAFLLLALDGHAFARVDKESAAAAASASATAPHVDAAAPVSSPDNKPGNSHLKAEQVPDSQTEREKKAVSETDTETLPLNGAPPRVADLAAWLGLDGTCSIPLVGRGVLVGVWFAAFCGRC